MDSMLWTAPLLRAFESRIQRRISLNQLSTLMGHAKAFLAQILAHARGPRVGDLFEAQLKVGDENPPDLYHQAYEKAANDPLRILAACRRRQDMEPHLFLLAIAPRILALVEAGTSDPDWRSRIEEIRGYEKLVEFDRKKSQETIERAISIGLRFLERRKIRPAGALGDLGLALASLSVVLRMNGNLDDSLDALLLSYPLVLSADSPLHEGLWYQRSAYLLVRFGRYDRAAEFIKDATFGFVAAASARDIARTLVDLGHVLSCAGQGEEACKQLKRALCVLDPGDRAYMCAAHQILGLELAALGKTSEAEAQLRLACAAAAEIKPSLASIHWTRARLHRQQKSFGSAITDYKAAFELLSRYGAPSKVVTLTFEFAKLLLRLKDRPELDKLAAEVSRYGSVADMAPELQEAMENFTALQALKPLDLQAFEELRNSLPEPANDTDDRNRSNNQPTGSICGPFSSASLVAELLLGGSWARGSSAAV